MGYHSAGRIITARKYNGNFAPDVHESPAERWANAICSDLSPEDSERIFFRGTGRPPKNPEYRQICGNCPVKSFCGEYGIVHEEAGVWGGLSEAERTLLPPLLRPLLVQKAKDEGWFEYRRSVDEIVAAISQMPLDLTEPVDELSHVTNQAEIFHFDFEVESADTVAPSSSKFFFDFETAS